MDFPRNRDFSELIARVARALSARQLPFMLIGGQAVLLHGDPRLTQDVDITLAAAPDRLEDVLAVCATARLDPLPQDVAQFVRETFVLPAADPVTGIRVDLIFSTTPYEAEAIRRAVIVRVGDASVPFASAEDLIIHKLFAGRPRDLEDAAGVVRRKGGQLDWSYVDRWIKAFSQVPGREDLLDKLRVLKAHAKS